MKHILAALSLLISISLSGNLLAGGTAPPPIPTVTENLNGVNGIVNILEVETAAPTLTAPLSGSIIPFSGSYLVDVLHPEAFITAIAVSTSSGFDGGASQRFSHAWISMFLSEADWNSNTGGPAWIDTSLFNFDDMFGLDDTGVNFYFNFDPVFYTAASDVLQEANDHDNPTAADAGSAYFMFGSDLASNFAAFDPSGNLVDQSHLTAQIPVPMPLLLIALGLFGILRLQYR